MPPNPLRRLNNSFGLIALAIVREGAMPFGLEAGVGRDYRRDGAKAEAFGELIPIISSRAFRRGLRARLGAYQTLGFLDAVRLAAAVANLTATARPANSQSARIDRRATQNVRPTGASIAKAPHDSRFS